MSDFVPLRTDGRFRRRLLAGEEPDAVGESGGRESGQATADGAEVEGNSMSDEAALDPEGVDGDEVPALPQNIEELDALINEVEARAIENARAEFETAQTELQAEWASVQRTVNDLDRARDAWASEVRGTVGELLIVALRQVVGESAELRTAALCDRLGEVAQRLVGEREVIVRVRPEDEERARALIGDRVGWKVATDEQLSGGLVAETESGRIDASLGASIAGVTKAVQHWLDESATEEGSK